VKNTKIHLKNRICLEQHLDKGEAGMKIRPLEWVKNESGLVEAQTPFGLYELNEMPNGTIVSFIPAPTSCRRISDKL